MAWQDGAIEVRTRDGGVPSQAEVDEVTREENPFLIFEVLGRAIAAVPLPRGEAVELPETAFHGLGNRGLVPERVRVTYVGMDGDLARIDVDVALAKRDEGLELTVAVTGTTHFDRAGWCRDVDVTAEIGAELGGASVGGGLGKGTIVVSPRR